MYSIILVPLDGSHRAEAIIPHVLQLAAHYEAEVILLQVIELPHFVNLPQKGVESYEGVPHLDQDDVSQMVEEAEVYLDKQVTNLLDKGIKAQAIIAHGPIAATILKSADESNADLIAMASHGCSGLQGVYYGSVAAGVLQRVDRPLLIVRSQ